MTSYISNGMFNSLYNFYILLLTFFRGEKTLTSYRVANMNTVDWKLPSSKFVDGIAVDVDGFERIIFESSGGFHAENSEHAAEDTVKQMQSCISSLKSDALNHLDASFETLQRRRILALQTIKSKETLTEARINKEKRWEIVELGSATIPMKWRERYEWLKVYELAATILVGIYRKGSAAKH